MTRRAALGERDPVAVAPDAGEVLEVRRAVARAVGVVPEADRHRRHRPGDDQLALLADQRAAVRRERLDRAAEVAAADLALPDRDQRRGADERGAHVGAAGDRLEVDRWADRLVHVAEALGRQRRARRADALEPRQVARLGRPQPSLRQAMRYGADVPKYVTPPRPPAATAPRGRGAPATRRTARCRVHGEPGERGSSTSSSRSC